MTSRATAIWSAHFHNFLPFGQFFLIPALFMLSYSSSLLSLHLYHLLYHVPAILHHFFAPILRFSLLSPSPRWCRSTPTPLLVTHLREPTHSHFQPHHSLLPSSRHHCSSIHLPSLRAAGVPGSVRRDARLLALRPRPTPTPRRIPLNHRPSGTAWNTAGRHGPVSAGRPSSPQSR